MGQKRPTSQDDYSLEEVVDLHYFFFGTPREVREAGHTLNSEDSPDSQSKQILRTRLKDLAPNNLDGLDDFLERLEDVMYDRLSVDSFESQQQAFIQ